MAEIIEGVMHSYGIAQKWGVCIADNADNCNTCCKTLVASLRPDEPVTARRSRCFGYIVNLAAKAFIYGKEYEAFIAEAEQVIVLSSRDQSAAYSEMQLWRRRESFGKFHNIVKHIRVSTHRRQKVEAIIIKALTSQNEVVDATELGVENSGVEELERVFSQAKRFFTDDRNRLLTTSFEALQCLEQWQTQQVYDVYNSARISISPTNEALFA
ncbi:uncharacterized protein PV07_02948 [Cladophialophora immunda]|uniref:HAT C-terminal dimerisation domain-containing protein n=1 Tax=Cladophialophora immunda TaxID=569365 RepID=A0A0D2CJG2_9EURO|nr:uncharacterized protein PV07_02948 [Cladophialophora immunda]KIW31288.1 hypothetical protein PV07_02948 [Cladophialophora immunda]